MGSSILPRKNRAFGPVRHRCGTKALTKGLAIGG
jgi:hypothetical protein